MAAIGSSSAADATRAGKEAAVAAASKCVAGEPRLAIVFASSWFDQITLVKAIAEVLEGVPLVGASTAGEILESGPVSHTCLVVLLASKTMRWTTGFAERLEEAPRKAGQQVAYMASKSFPLPQRIGFLFFGDGLSVRYSEVMSGIQEVLGTSSLLVGGMAGDDLRFSHTYQYHGGQVITGGIVGVLFGGQGSLGIGIEHGFAPISKPRRVTRASANRLIELDRKPAASVYEEYLGADVLSRMRLEGVTRQSLAYPLGIQTEGSNQFLLRNVVAFKDDGSLSCSGEVMEGSWMQLMISSRSLGQEAARRAAQKALETVPKPACVLVFSSFARMKLQGPGAMAAEIAVIRQVIGRETPVAGFYSYAEQASSDDDPLHQRVAMQTGSVLVLAIGA